MNSIPNWDGIWTGYSPTSKDIKNDATSKHVNNIRGLENAGRNELFGIGGDYDKDGVAHEGLIQDVVARRNNSTQLFRPPTEEGIPQPNSEGSSGSAEILAPNDPGQGVVV